MNTFAIYFAICAALLVGTLLVPSSQGEVRAFLLGSAAGMVPVWMAAAIEARASLRLLFVRLEHRNNDLRLSVSYLLRIRDGAGRHLLIRGHRYPEQFQPVGGVYKVSEAGASDLHAIGTRADDLIAADIRSEGDLRIILPAKNLVRFMRWFEAGLGRETGPWREFEEELLRPGLVDRDLFPYLKYGRILRHVEGVRWSPQAQKHEMLIADIFDVSLDSEQVAELERAAEANSDHLIWSSEAEIRRRGAVEGQDRQRVISLTANWIL